MFGLDIITIAVVALSAVSAAAVAYGLLYARIEVENRTALRVNRVKSAETDTAKVKAARDRVQEMSKRRKSVQDSLKDLERKQKEKSHKLTDASIKSLLVQAGLRISVKRFYLLSAAFGLFVLVCALMAELPLLASLGFAFVTCVGIPRWVVAFLVKRRRDKFVTELPNALDVMVRSIKSGLPLNDSLRLIAADGQEPVKTEFQQVVEAQQMGLSVPDAIARMLITMPLPEVNFFTIVIAIQSQAGGNLSEALGNLSKVLRDRKKMKAKVSALSMEAKASGCIIGALPFIVALLVYFTSPNYIMVLVQDPRGHMILGASAVWMAIGIYVMRNMINFDI